MNWFQRTKDAIHSETEKKELPNVWIKCDQCGEVLYKRDLLVNLRVCMKCGYHFRIFSRSYIEFMLDAHSFEPFNQNIISVDKLQFTDTKKYADRIKASLTKSHLKDAVSTGFGKIFGIGRASCRERVYVLV